MNDHRARSTNPKTSLWHVVSPCLLLLGCDAATPPASPIPRDQITQISVINALMMGEYDGIVPIRTLLRFGDFGLGTLDHLDGELIVLDGQAFQIRSTGEVVKVPADATTPFAVVTSFEQDGELSCREVQSLNDLDALIDKNLVHHHNNFVAIRRSGRFASITMRSVGRQERPYRPLGEVARSQSVWTKTNVSGTLLGIRSPTWTGGLTVAGYHWHFLSADHAFGGHVLDLKLEAGKLEYDVCADWQIKLEESAAFNALDLARDQSKDLRRVESSRGEAEEKPGPER